MPTVNEVVAADRSVADGVLVDFAYTFKIYLKTDIEVLVDDTAKVVDTDFSVSGLGASGGGTVTFLIAPANLAVVTRIRKQPASQLSVYTPNEDFPAARIEKDFDKVVMLVQQLWEKSLRSLTFKKSSTLTNGLVDAPVAGQFVRAKTGGGFDFATPTAAGPLSSPVAIADGGTGSTTAAAARTALGVSEITPSDATFRVVGSGDATKKLAFEVDGITAGATRVLTPPDADLTLPAITTKGDMVAASASGVLARVAAGAAGTIPMTRAAATPGVAFVAALNKIIYGLTYDNGTDATNDLNINVGGAMDATGAYFMTLAAALGKQSDVAWAVGGTTAAPVGGLDTGAVGNSDYYIWLIARSDTGVVDALFSLSSTAPTMPANYDFKRLIGWFKRVGGTIVAFKTYETEGGGIELRWTVPTLDISAANALTTTRRTDNVKVPLTFSVTAIVTVQIYDVAAAIAAFVGCPDRTDEAVVSQTATANEQTSSAGDQISATRRIRTSATGQIAARANTATVDLYQLITEGFEWARRN